jgi:hypothetical protein
VKSGGEFDNKLLSFGGGIFGFNIATYFIPSRSLLLSWSFSGYL